MDVSMLDPVRELCFSVLSIVWISWACNNDIMLPYFLMTVFNSGH